MIKATFQISFILLCGVILISCVSAKGYTYNTLVKIEPRKYEPINAKNFSFENKDIKAVYVPDIENSGISFNIENKTNKPIKIIWDQTTYISPFGSSQRVFHSGITIKDRNKSQPPSLIAPKTNFIDDITPTGNISWETGNDYSSGRWDYVPLCGKKSIFTLELDDSNCKGKVFGYFITYEKAGKTKSFTVKFKYISKIKVKKKERRTPAVRK